SLAVARACAHASQRQEEPILVERLQDVVDGVQLEGSDRVSIESGDKNQQRRIVLLELGGHFEAGHSRHLDVEEGYIGCMPEDCLGGTNAVVGLCDDFKVALLLEP